MYPFVYCCYDEIIREKKWVVTIAPFGYDSTDLHLCPENLPVESIHEFESEQESMEFVQRWWANQNIVDWYNVEKPEESKD